MDLSKLGMKPFWKYYYHPESDSYVKLKADERPDPALNEIAKEIYDAGLARAGASAAIAAVESLSTPTEEGQPDRNVVESVDDSVGGTSPDVPSESADSESVSAPTTTIVSSVPGQESFGPADFQDMLAKLDNLIGETTGISNLQMDMARGYVRDIMKTLSTHPEYDGILVDKDIHNVMVFVQSSMNLATADFVVKKQKAETRAVKKAKTGGMTFSMVAFETPGAAAAPAQDLSQALASLDAFAGMNFDNIQPKNKK